MTAIIFGVRKENYNHVAISFDRILPRLFLSMTSWTGEKIKAFLWNLILEIFTKVRRNFPIQLKSGRK